MKTEKQQSAVEWYNESLKNLIKESELTDMRPSEFDSKEMMLIEQAKKMEKEQIVIAEIETLRVIEKYGISSIEPLINELKNQIETFKSE